jgi:uncharacterized Zn finger protein
MSWGYFEPKPSVAELRARAAQAARKLRANGQTLEPVNLISGAIGQTFWGKAWCKNIEQYSDYAYRLPRGRTYARNGLVLDLRIKPGLVTALVSGSSVYKIEVKIDPIDFRRWETFVHEAAGKITNLLDLLQGKLSPAILAAITEPHTGLFPAPRQIHFKCSCPDSASLCKHVAATLYGVGMRLDVKPELFFTLRGADMQSLISAASVQASAPAAQAAGSKRKVLAEADLGSIFGVDIDSPAAAAPKARAEAIKPAKTTPARKPSKPVAKPAARKTASTKVQAKPAKPAPKRKPTR